MSKQLPLLLRNGELIMSLLKSILPIVGEPDYPQFAKNEWLKLVVDDKDGVIFRSWLNKIPNEDYIRNIEKAFKLKNVMFLQLVYTVNDAYTSGLKVVRPTLDQCLALENVELNIPLTDYKQPYQTIFVEYPQQYKRHLTNKYSCTCPDLTALHATDNYLLCTNYLHTKAPTISFAAAIKHTLNIEDIISSIEDKKEANVTLATNRVAFNLMLMMTNFGFDHIGYENVKQHRYYERKEPARAKQDAYYVALKQEIKLYEKRIVSESTGSGSPKQPHWRRGHWRMQAYGKDHSLRKPIFIKPIFIHSDLFKGSMVDTRVTYEG